MPFLDWILGILDGKKGGIGGDDPSGPWPIDGLWK